MDNPIYMRSGVAIYGEHLCYRGSNFALSAIKVIGFHEVLARQLTNYTYRRSTLNTSRETMHFVHLTVSLGSTSFTLSNRLRQATDIVARKAAKVVGFGYMIAGPLIDLATYASNKLAGDAEETAAELKSVHALLSSRSAESRAETALRELQKTGTHVIPQMRLRKTLTLETFPSIVFSNDGILSVGQDSLSLENASAMPFHNETGTDWPYYEISKGGRTISFSAQCNSDIIQLLLRKYGVAFAKPCVGTPWQSGY